MRVDCVILAVLLAGPVLGMASVRGAEIATTQITIDLHDVGEPFVGWGTSLAWWAHGVGDWPDEQLDRLVHRIVDPKDGLGLNVFRYNIGGGDAPGHNHLQRTMDVPGFKASNDAPYDWNADANQRRVLLKLIKASAEKPIVEAFSNSPPWWMTVSGCVSGASDGGPNLKREFEITFADYLADVAVGYRDRHGITFDSVEPFNEPDANWWKAGTRQEGTAVPHDQQARVIRLTRAALDQRKLQSTIISAPDANNINKCLAALRSYDEPTLAAIGRVNTHSYGGDARVALRDLAAQRGKELWQSETGPLHVRASEADQIMVMAQRIVTDLNQLRPSAWCMWQVVAGKAWGCLHEVVNKKDFTVGKAFDMYATFTRHIRPGDRIVKLESENVVATLSSKRREITVVVVNRDPQPQEVVLRLKNADGASPALTTSARYTKASGKLHEAAGDPFRDGVLKIAAPAESVTCLVFAAPWLE